MWYVIWLLIASENCTCNFYYQMSTFKFNSLAKKIHSQINDFWGFFCFIFFSEDFLHNNIVSVSFN